MKRRKKRGKKQAMLETISTLKFANRAKNIRNEAKVNEDLDQKSLLRKYERELKKLRAELEERSKNVVDKRRLLELDEQVRLYGIVIFRQSLSHYVSLFVSPTHSTRALSLTISHAHSQTHTLSLSYILSFSLSHTHRGGELRQIRWQLSEPLKRGE